ncbi:MAG: phosphocholine cytidylyltransferase family protein [Rhodospirillales bacterium]|nr:phosphocholine cytidylyltransferase family protein [Rhodospirillales bacterium]
MLAAGMGRRLSGEDGNNPPKALLRFESKSLLARHIEALRTLGVADLTLIVGYRRDDILSELAEVAPPGFVRTIVNPDFQEGSNLSLAKAGEVLTSDATILFMDADVLYHFDILRRLLDSPHNNCLVMDRNLEPGEDPVKICVQDGVLVDFGKTVRAAHDQIGEWPGFARFSPLLAKSLATNVAALGQQRRDAPYEDAMHTTFMAAPGAIGIEDITGIPWIEIDFPEDVAHARAIVMRRIAAMTPSGRR